MTSLRPSGTDCRLPRIRGPTMSEPFGPTSGDTMNDMEGQSAKGPMDASFACPCVCASNDGDRICCTSVGGDKLDVSISAVGILVPAGTFTVEGEAAEYLCPGGTWEVGDQKIWNESDTGFKIRQDNIFTCTSGEIFVLELRNTIVLGEGGVPGKGTWKLKDSTGFDRAPMGKGQILAGEEGEIFEGLLQFK